MGRATSPKLENIMTEKITGKTQSIIDFIKKNPTISPKEIASIFDIGTDYIRKLKSRYPHLFNDPIINQYSLPVDIKCEVPRFGYDDIEAWFKNAIRKPKELIYPKSEPGNESVMDLDNDWHIGAEIKNEFGEVIFNMNIAQQMSKAICEKKLALVDGYLTRAHKIDEWVLMYNGDIIEGEGIHPDQIFSSECDPPQQTLFAFDVIHDKIFTIRKMFPNIPIRVLADPGNHGRIGGAKGHFNPKTNMDLMLYRMIAKFIDIPNFSVEFRECGYINFEVKDGNII